MVWKLLRHNINMWQIAAWATASFVGLCVIGLALQFYRDVSTGTSGSKTDPLEEARYLILSHPARTTIFGGQPDGITPAEVQEITGQPWAENAEVFTPAGFDVSVSLSAGTRGFSTAIFLEGVSEAYLDVMPQNWGFDPEAPQVPIILPREYLALYNFGFAPARGLPVIDERTAMLAPLNVILSGNGISQTIPGRIVGFSTRLNTIAVPEEFVSWANDKFSPNRAPKPNRMIVRLADPGNPEIARYLASHDLEKSSAGESSSRMYHFLRLVSGAVMGVGILICLLSLGLMTLSVFLILQKNRPAIASLLNLGYPPLSISLCYIRLTSFVNTCVLLMAASVTAMAAGAWHEKTLKLGLHPCDLWPTLAVMAGAIAILTAISSAAIHRSIRKVWRE